MESGREEGKKGRRAGGREATERPPTKHDSMCSVLDVSLGLLSRCLRRTDSLARRAARLRERIRSHSSCVKQRGKTNIKKKHVGSESICCSVTVLLRNNATPQTPGGKI